MSELSDRAKLLEEAAKLNLAHARDIARWFNRIAEHWLKTGVKIDPSQVRHHMYSEMRELWRVGKPALVPPSKRNSYEYDRWVCSWVMHFLGEGDLNRDEIILVIDELREWLKLPPLDIQ